MRSNKCRYGIVVRLPSHQRVDRRRRREADDSDVAGPPLHPVGAFGLICTGECLLGRVSPPRGPTSLNIRLVHGLLGRSAQSEEATSAERDAADSEPGPAEEKPRAGIREPVHVEEDAGARPSQRCPPAAPARSARPCLPTPPPRREPAQRQRRTLQLPSRDRSGTMARVSR